MRISQQDNRRTVHAGHTYINGIHWLRYCELCMRLMAKADAIAKVFVENGMIASEERSDECKDQSRA